MNVSIDHGVLRCPHCGSECLHHNLVEIFECKEDSASGMHVQVCGVDTKDGYEPPLVISDNNLSGNPSERRHGLRILFWCEVCDECPSLAVAQHKGSTLVEWQAGS